MNPIRVTIQNIVPGQEIPDTHFTICDHHLSRRALDLTVKDSDSKIQALWDEVNKKLYLVGDPYETLVESKPNSKTVLFAFTTELPSIKVSIDLSPLRKIRELKIFKMSPKKSADHNYLEASPYRDRQEKLLMSIDTQAKQIVPTHRNKKTAPIHQIPLQRLEPGQDIPVMDFEVLSFRIVQSAFSYLTIPATLKLFIADYILDDSAPPQIQALWDETNKKFYLAGGKFDYLPGRMILKPKRREIWLHIDISSLGLEGKLKIYKISDEIWDLDENGQVTTLQPRREDLLLVSTIQHPHSMAIPLRKQNESN
jgi:hypothetical protein